MKRTTSGWRGGVACLVLLGACSAIEPVPSCDNPAPLHGRFDARAPGFIIELKPDVSVQTEVQHLSAKYDFTPSHVWESAVKGFSAQLSSSAVNGLRCEASVVFIEHDALVTVATRVP